MKPEIVKELKDLNSMLASLPKIEEQVSDVPAGFFDQMEDNFFAKLELNQAPKEAKGSFFGAFSKNYAIAAVVAFLFVGFLSYTLIDIQNQQFQLSKNEIQEYLMDYDLTEPSSFVESESELMAYLRDSLNMIPNESIEQYIKEYEVEEYHL